jgi:hypothetical protein
MGAWSPLGGTEWLRNPDWILDEPLPENPATVPARNGLPEPVPYRYQGTTLDGAPEEDTAAAVVVVVRKAPRKRGPAPIDPGGPPAPFSAPLEWLRWLEYEEKTP